MSENIPESVPTSQDPRSHRPLKRRALSPTSKTSAQIDALFANPDRDLTPTGARAKTLAAPPEIVSNVQGSSAGAGSGEFHVYKASRRREYERLRMMDEEKEKEESDAKYEAEREEKKRKDEEKTEKKRKEREKAKMRKMKAKSGEKQDGGEAGTDTDKGIKTRLKPNVGSNGNGGHKDGYELENAPAQEEVGITIHDDDD